MNREYAIWPLGETGLLVRFGETISPEVHRRVKALSDYLDSHPFPGMVETVISYTSLAVYYQPFEVLRGRDGTRSAFQVVSDLLNESAAAAKAGGEGSAHVVRIPVCYGGEYGPDLDYVAEYHQLTPEEVVEIHTAPEYLVYMIGFCPGFPYLGGMDKRIATPRRETPRVEIPARSIGIAGEQTGGYPICTPGGWQLIGRTPMDMFDIGNEERPSLLQAGDRVKFYAVSEEEYRTLREEYGYES